MGLAGPKRRSKISSDPNNTAWSSRTDTFGHKILKSQGWTPGSYLGAENAAHKEHYTAANASHIRVLLKEDNLGLGASRKKEGAETFGLDQFSGLLGRLNGKSEETLGKEEDARRDVKLRLWADRKGGLRFVSAGFLVGDKVEKLRREEVERQQTLNEPDPRGKKRKADGKVKPAEKPQPLEQTIDSAANAREQDTETQNPTVAGEDTKGLEEERATKRRLKEERRQRNQAKEERKEAKRIRREEREDKRRRKEERRKSKSVSESENTRITSSAELVAVLEPSDSSDARQDTRTIAIPRRMVRSRYIQQKRAAGLDPKALNEIFMIKPPT
ncbi:Protein pxr1 [Sphaceloma murrayae]|uniref:PinX1-related protein 1 n=1 Tax=Sphaceloma murrayae TaxID=2082308 RepID=A0A2K1QRV0_9PEZI|nr:Protein pxr1 [Sphaceloma murrayae]